MQTYKINDNLTIEAESYETSRNWGHKARAYYNGQEVASTKCVYQNRTWESYQYQSVMQKLVDVMDEYKTIPLKDRYEANVFLKTGDRRDLKALQNVGMIATLGSMFFKDQKQSNEFKTKILGTIPGLDIEAIDGINEADKTKRLDGVIKILTRI